nr:MAG TPA: hypothetical protein [Caudoviricetes sp.]
MKIRKAISNSIHKTIRCTFKYTCTIRILSFIVSYNSIFI